MAKSRSTTPFAAGFDVGRSETDLVGADTDALEIDPFAAHSVFDPVAVGERVTFKLWAEAAVSGKAIEQARKQIAGGRLRLDRALVDLGCVDPEAAAAALADEIGAPLCDPGDYPSEPVLEDALPHRFVAEARVLPLHDDGAALELAMADPLDDYALRAVGMKTRRTLRVRVASTTEIDREVARLYGLTPTTAAPRRPAADLADEIDARRRARDRDRATRPQLEDHRPAPAPLLEAPSNDVGARAVARSSVSWTGDDGRGGSWGDDRLDHETVAEEDLFDDETVAIDEAPFDPEPLDARDADYDVYDYDGGEDGFEEPHDDEAPYDAYALERSPRWRSGVGEDAAHGDMDDDAVSTPRFVRPKRVTLKNAAADRDRRFVSGYVDGFIGADPEGLDDDLAIPEADRPARKPLDAEARREALARVRSALRANAAETARGRPAEAPLPDGELVRRVDGARASAAHAEEPFELDAPIGAEDEAAPMSDAARSIPRSPRARAGRFIDPRAVDAVAASLARRGASDPILAAELRGGAAEPSIGRDRRQAAQAAEALSARIDAVGARVSGRRSSVSSDDDIRRRAAFAPSGEAAPSDLGSLVRHTLAGPVRPAAPSRRAAAGGRARGRGLNALDFPPAARVALTDALAAGDGLILICGPSGSGKVQTLDALAEAATEDGGEIARFDDGSTAERGAARAAVRIGEIRDAESAEFAARAAMRGELVIATLDAPSVAAVAPRLTALGLPPFVLASSLRVAVAQHLAPRRCPRCFGTGRRSDGGVCGDCHGDGLSGHVAIVEAMTPDDAARGLILAQAPEAAFRHAMAATGAPSLADDAAEKVAAGVADAADVAFAAAAARL